MTTPRSTPPGRHEEPDSRSGRAAPPELRAIRRWSAGLLGVESLVLLGAATYSFIVVSEAAGSSRFGTGLGLFILLFAAAVALAARSVLIKGRFGVGFGITWQLFQALVGASMLSAGLILPGVLAIGASIAVFVLLTQVVRATPLPYDLEGPDDASTR